jgi:hypothetical protein
MTALIVVSPAVLAILVFASYAYCAAVSERKKEEEYRRIIDKLTRDLTEQN